MCLNAARFHQAEVVVIAEVFDVVGAACSTNLG